MFVVIIAHNLPLFTLPLYAFPKLMKVVYVGNLYYVKKWPGLPETKLGLWENIIAFSRFTRIDAYNF